MSASSPPVESASTSANTEPQWGRVLLCGGTDWPRLGRKDRGGSKKAQEPTTTNIGPDLLEPHILRSLNNVKITSVHTSCAGCQVVALDADGAAWLFGRNDRSALGVASVEAISENAPMHLTARELGAPKGTRFVYAACGRSHTLLVGSGGQLWTAGANQLGQCGHPPCPEIPAFKLVQGPRHGGVKESVMKAAAGITFSILLTASGKVFALGSGEHGQLGNGRTGEHIVSAGKTAFDVESEPILVKGLEGKKITQIACGQQHSIALDSEGVVYVWGYNGYCRLGLGNQQDVLIPKPVPQFAGSNDNTRGAQVVAGPSNSVVIDKQGMYWMAGKWKNTGDGSSGQPYSTFRYIQDIMGCKVVHAACGGVTHWALAPDEDDSIMTIAFGQGASNGELGLGPNEGKSATKPTRHQPLIGIEVFQIAGSQNTTFFLAKPNEKMSDLPRHPVDLESPDQCIACNTVDDDTPLLACDKCDHPYHTKCLDPPLNEVPDGEWFCPECEESPGAPIGPEATKAALTRAKSKASRKAEIETEEEDMEPTTKTGQKRKASAAKSSSAATKRRK
ncbi:RCC1/BLIP-II protein [Daedalea quercina L-15889]|uniref:RCC1/BLIP-II protein n=1 Tax=Daedalea quercina L-15889 TaxID=1314783 RepID=A0A165QBF2_9APHY|nr:RCC1/BLIP-II protein [Daedalea quercina L-15889]